MYMLKRRGAKTDPCGTPFFRRRSLLCFAVTSGQGEASVPNKFHDHPDHVLVRQKSQQLAGEDMVPDSVASSCQINKHGISLLFCSKRILNVLCEQNDLICGRLSVSKSSLFFWKQGIDYWFNAIVD